MTRKQRLNCLKVQNFIFRVTMLWLIINALFVQGYVPYNLLFFIFDLFIFIFMLLSDIWYFPLHKDEMQTVGKYRRFDRLVMSISFFYALLINLLYWNCVVYSWYHFYDK